MFVFAHHQDNLFQKQLILHDLMDNLHNRLTSDLGKKNEIFCYN